MNWRWWRRTRPEPDENEAEVAQRTAAQLSAEVDRHNQRVREVTRAAQDMSRRANAFARDIDRALRGMQ